MIVYNFDPDTFEYTGSTKANKNPLEKGQFILPANATFSQVPKIPENNTAVFIDNKWKVVFDLRGLKYYAKDGTVSKITAIGEKVPSGHVTNKPPSIYHTEHNGKTWSVDMKKARDICKAHVIFNMDTVGDKLLSGYSNTEQKSFPYQKQEAELWISSYDPETSIGPVSETIDAIIQQTGADKMELCQRILKKSSEMKVNSGRLIGQRNLLFAKIDDAKTYDDLMSLDLTIL